MRSVGGINKDYRRKIQAAHCQTQLNTDVMGIIRYTNYSTLRTFPVLR